MNFSDFYFHVHGYMPYQWQVDLADKVAADGVWPSGVSAPTGSGKTSSIDIAVWHLYHQVSQGEKRTAPLRIAFGVERRLIVDDVAAHAQKIADSVESNPALSEVRDTLRTLTPEWMDDAPTIRVTSMHGGTSWDALWWCPVGCSIITGTMTQISSRIFYNGVGESPGQRMISAGVLGSDTLRICDEPHLMVPAVHALFEQETFPSLAPPQTTVLGATVPESLRYGRWVADFDRGRRVPLDYVPCGTSADMVKEIADRAMMEHEDGGEVVVIVSTTSLARKVAKRIKKIPVQVVTSHVRPVDRKGIEIPQKDAIIVATQTLEVGVDFDAKVIISDMAPLVSLVQREGRAGRHGREAKFIVVDSEKIDAGVKFIYGEDVILATRDVISECESLADVDPEMYPVWPVEARRVELDTHMAELLASGSEAPWEAFVYGPDHQNSSSVEVCWREEPHLADRVWPSSQETISLPINVVKSVVNGNAQGIDAMDVDGIPGQWRGKRGTLEGVYLLHGGEISLIEDSNDISPGDTVVLHVDHGMYSPEMGFDSSIHSPVDDVVVESRVPTRTHYLPVRSVLSTGEIEAIASGDIDSSSINGYQIVDSDVMKFTVGVERAQGGKVLLADHLHQVSNYAQDISICAGQGDLSDDFRIAGLHHDIGKRVPGFQMMLGNGNGGEPLAKSSGKGGTRGALPSPWRHETVVSQVLQSEYPVASWLVADHHGKGIVHKMGERAVQCSEYPYDVWSSSYLSSLHRWADWKASASPVEYGLTMSDLELDLLVDDDVDLMSPQDRNVGDVISLDGVTSNPHSGLWAAIGAFASVKDRCPDALFRVHNGVPQIANGSVDDIVWDAYDIEVYQSHRVGKCPVWMTNSYWHIEPKKGVVTPSAATMMVHNNSNCLGGASSDSVSTEVLFEKDYGWDNGKAGGFDVCAIYGDIGGVEPLVREDVLSWAAHGQFSMGAPQSPRGVGVRDKVLYTPVPSDWVTWDELVFMVRNGYGNILHSNLVEVVQKQFLWM